MSARPSIIGIAEIPPRRDPGGATTIDLGARAARDALLDAALTPADVDGLLIAPSFSGAPITIASMVADVLGVQPTYCDVVDLGGATATGMVWRAAAAIEAGACRAVLCVLAQGVDPRAGAPGLSWPQTPLGQWERPYGSLGPNSGYALAAMRHAHEFGTTDAQRAKVAVDQRTNACAHPDALFHGRPITVDDVLASPLVCDPLHLLEIVMPCSGATAFVVARADVAAGAPHPPVALRGFGEQVTHSSLVSLPDVTRTGITASAGRAFAAAGVTTSDIDVLSLYDCYTITVILTLEDAGFCAKGAGGPFVADHDLTFSGDLPCNTHGGQLSYGQAGLAGGASHVTEAVMQLRGRAGARQVPDCALALVNGNGGVLAEQCTLVLERGDS
ncbi:MAG: thiolase family protein [Actinomycetota bacterium]